jgi:hypothetical protein
MALRFLVIIALSFGAVACGVKGDPLPRVKVES